MVSLIGSNALLGALLFAVGGVVLGGLVATGSWETRTAMATLAPQRNAGPIFAAIGIAFNNDSAMIGTASAILLMIPIITVPVAAYLADRRALAEVRRAEVQAVPREAASMDGQGAESAARPKRTPPGDSAA